MFIKKQDFNKLKEEIKELSEIVATLKDKINLHDKELSACIGKIDYNNFKMMYPQGTITKESDFLYSTMYSYYYEYCYDGKIIKLLLFDEKDFFFADNFEIKIIDNLAIITLKYKDYKWFVDLNEKTVVRVPKDFKEGENKNE